MKPGESYNCPKCGKNTFLKKVSVMDGWTKLGDILACASCSAKVADLNSTVLETEKEKTTSVSKLASFLNTEEEKKPQIKAAENEKRFCKNCMHFIVHPFLSRCSRHGKDVNPMDDCPDYRPRKDIEK